MIHMCICCLYVLDMHMIYIYNDIHMIYIYIYTCVQLSHVSRCCVARFLPPCAPRSCPADGSKTPLEILTKTKASKPQSMDHTK